MDSHFNPHIFSGSYDELLFCEIRILEQEQYILKVQASNRSLEKKKELIGQAHGILREFEERIEELTKNQ